MTGFRKEQMFRRDSSILVSNITQLHSWKMRELLFWFRSFTKHPYFARIWLFYIDWVNGIKIKGKQKKGLNYWPSEVYRALSVSSLLPFLALESRYKLYPNLEKDKLELDSNHRPITCKSNALTTVLFNYKKALFSHQRMLHLKQRLLSKIKSR